MPNYIVTLHQYNGCYNFLCTDAHRYEAVKAINEHANEVDFIGDPDITEVSDVEFSLFVSKRIPVLVNGALIHKTKEAEADLDHIEQMIKNRTKGAHIDNKDIYKLWERYNFCTKETLSSKLNLTKSVISNKITSFIKDIE